MGWILGFKNPVPQNFFGCFSFGRLLFCGCFYTVITSELRGLREPSLQSPAATTQVVTM